MSTGIVPYDGEKARIGESGVVARTALFDVLAAAGPRGVTLISAPAGSGKTVLLRSWLDEAGLREHVAWVSVERDEQDAQRFWLAMVAALRGAIGADAFIEKLAPTPSFDGRAVVERLLSQLGSLEEPVVLVIDDLHELASREAQDQLEVLLAGRPDHLRIVLATRRDPQLGLHRLRLDGQLTEIRAPELRFTLEEARALLGAAGLTLSAQAVAVLHARTEGWAAGLRLAALSLNSHPDPERFVTEFSGSERTIADYLLAEVLERQPESVRRLLLRTSILDRVNGPLADILTGEPGSEGTLHELEQTNAFVVALDPERTWFRYHALFADLLRLELRRTESELVPTLHRAAAEWFAQHGHALEAIRCAQVAEDWQYATRLLADNSLSFYLRGQSATTRALLETFPPDWRADPELILDSASDSLVRGNPDEAAVRIELAERGATTVAPERRQFFDLKLAAMRLVLARRRGDFSSVLGEVQSIRDLLDEQTAASAFVGDEARAVVLMNLGIAELWSQLNEDSEHHLTQGLELARQIQAPYLELGCLAHLVVATAAFRPLALAREYGLQAVAVADAHGWTTQAIGGVAPLQLAATDILQGRFEEGRAWLERAGNALHGGVDPAAELLLHLVRGWLSIADGQREAALHELRAAAQAQALLVAPQRLSIPARSFVIQTLLNLDDTPAARAALADVPSDERDSAEIRIASACLDLADGEAAAAIDALSAVVDRSIPATKIAGIQACLVAALAREALGDEEAAQLEIEQALEMAEPDGIVFPFAATPVRELLERHRRQRTAHPTLLSDILDVLAGSQLTAPAGERPALREDLSESELRVLRYLPSNLSAREIGSELYLSVTTIKTHMRHIYTKLGVHRRTEAVERARQLGLLAPFARRR